MELFADQWRVDKTVLDQMQRSLGRGTYRLLPTAESQGFVSEWRLYVPAGVPIEEWVRG